MKSRKRRTRHDAARCPALNLGRCTQTSASNAETSYNSGSAQEKSDLDEDLASVQKVWFSVLQKRIGQDAMKEQKRSYGKGEVVQPAPQGASDAMTQK